MRTGFEDMTSAQAWAWDVEARRSDAYRMGTEDGAAAGRARRPAASCDPESVVDERYAAMYRNGWEHAYRAEMPYVCAACGQDFPRAASPATPKTTRATELVEPS